jgi:hypothetical protein
VSLREQLSALYDKFSCSDITARYDAVANNMTLLTERLRYATPGRAIVHISSTHVGSSAEQRTVPLCRLSAYQFPRHGPPDERSIRPWYSRAVESLRREKRLTCLRMNHEARPPNYRLYVTAHGPLRHRP